MIKSVLRRTLPLAGVCIFPALAGNQVLLRNLKPNDGTPRILAADPAGHLFVVSTLTAGPAQSAARVVKLDLNGTPLASLDIPRIATPAAAVTDAQGNLIVAGLDALYQGVVLKLDSQLHAALFSKSLPASVNAIALDGSGNIYLTGVTSSATFPVTPGAYQTKPPGGATYSRAAYAFLTKLSPAGDQVLYSTYFGDDATHCIGGSSCIGAIGSTIGKAIAVDASGGVIIAGETTAYNLPVTPGALATTCACQYRLSAGFAAKFQPGAAQQLQWSTFLNGNGSPNAVSVGVDTLALDATGNVIVGGSGPPGLPTTAGTIQPSIIPVIGTGDSGGFLVKLNSTGTSVIWGTYFGGSPFADVKTLRVDAQGVVLFTGLTVNPSVPESLAGFQQTYVARLASDATKLIDFYAAPPGVAGQDLAIASTGQFASVGRAGALWIETAAPGSSLLAVTNSASGEYSSAVTGVELVTLYGVGIGPSPALDGQVVNGAFTSSLGGCQVLFDGAPAPLLYAGSGQINAVVPRVLGASTHIAIVTPAGTIDGPSLTVSPDPVPGVFQNSQTGLAAALNQDGTINSPSNPAPKGSIVTVFATGAGAGYFPVGSLAPIGIYDSSYTVWAGGQLSFEVLFAGDAPGLVTGVMQVNFRVPETAPAGRTFDFHLIVGGVSAGLSSIAVAP